MSWHELLVKYLEFLRATGRSAVTIEKTSYWIPFFADYCQAFDVTAPDQVLPQHAAAFEQKLLWEPGHHGELYAQNTVSNTLFIVRLFFRWAVKHGHLLLDAFGDVVLRRVPDPQRRFLTPQEVEKLLAAPDPTTWKGMRDRALLETLYGTGLRHAECHQLNVDDVDLDNLMLCVRRGKGSQARNQPLGNHLVEALQKYLQRGRPHLLRNPEEPALFLGARWGERLNEQTLGVLVKQYARAAALGRVTCHMLRHAFAMHLLEGGADVVEVQALLGHEHINSTSIYTNLRPGTVAREHRRHHPRARRKKRGKGMKPEEPKS